MEYDAALGAAGSRAAALRIRDDWEDEDYRLRLAEAGLERPGAEPTTSTEGRGARARAWWCLQRCGAPCTRTSGRA